MKIYTKTGDNGDTSLFDGSRVRKNHSRIRILGNIDELNSYIGLLISELSEENYKNTLYLIQNCLFEGGTEIANPSITESFFDFDKTTQKLELEMDKFDKELSELRSFILPGGTRLSSLSHICRAKARNVERNLVSFDNKVIVNKSFQRFLNRLSDYFFMLARKFNYDMNTEDILWRRAK